MCTLVGSRTMPRAVRGRFSGNTDSLLKHWRHNEHHCERANHVPGECGVNRAHQGGNWPSSPRRRHGYPADEIATVQYQPIECESRSNLAAMSVDLCPLIPEFMRSNECKIHRTIFHTLQNGVFCHALHALRRYALSIPSTRTDAQSIGSA